MTGKDANSLSSTDPIIVSFATDAGDYLHYYTNGTFKHSLVLNTRLANFTIINGKLYILTTDESSILLSPFLHLRNNDTYKYQCVGLFQQGV